jgi:hypothetical protein
MKIKRIVFTIGMMALSFAAVSQKMNWTKPDSLFKFVKPVASIQFWTLYTMGEQAQFAAGGPLERADDRVSFMVRRARFGFKGKPYSKLNYVVMIQYDNLGKDKLSGARGGTNTGQLGILDVYVTYAFDEDDRFSLTAGFFHPQVGRECITGDMNVTSFDKAITQQYIRQHITGKNYGRATGINLGGLAGHDFATIGYNVGIFNNNTTAADAKGFPETAGKLWSPLFAERLTLSLGDPDVSKYAINYSSNNYFDKRKGLTIGVNGTQQNRTEIFDRNTSIGFDILFNYAHFNLDAEWFSLKRSAEGFEQESQTFHIRAGYNLVLEKKFFIEPSVMVASFESFRGDPSGVDRAIDFGVNWYLNKKECKMSLHYVKQSGDGNNGYTDGTTFKKGDFAGLGMTILL